MRNALIVAMILAAVAVTAGAGLNPDVYAYITFDAAGDETGGTVDGIIVEPGGAGPVAAYVCLGDVAGGMTVVSFLLKNVLEGCPGVMVTQSFTSLLPGGMTIGAPFDNVPPGNTGISCASTECLSGTVVVGMIECYYLGGSCCMEILDHLEYPRWVVDCQAPPARDYYCLKYHGIVYDGVTMPTCDTVTEWPCDTPVEDGTWGGIKALYR